MASDQQFPWNFMPIQLYEAEEYHMFSYDALSLRKDTFFVLGTSHGPQDLLI